VDDDRRHERTLRMLEARLETLALVSEHSLTGGRSVYGRLLGAAAATKHAVELDLLSAEEAGRVWMEVAIRHPDVHWSAWPLETAA
jgi:hypothetical protein